jgi:hypothetical protein
MQLDPLNGLIRNWSEIDADEQEFLDLLATYGDGYFDMSLFNIEEKTVDNN